MKKKSKSTAKSTKSALCVIFAAFAFCFALSAPLCANAIDYIAEDWTFSVSYLGTPDEYYSLFAIEGDHTLTEMPSVTEENLIYINQQTADANGFVDFAGFSPMRESIATLYIGGSDLDTPLCLGRISDAAFDLVYTNTKIMFIYNSQRELVEFNGNMEKVKIPEGTRRILDIGIFENKGVTEITYPSTVLEIAEIITGTKAYYSPRLAIGFDTIPADELGQRIFIISDHNNDGALDYRDLQYFLKYTANPESHPADSTQSDVNIDENVSLTDLRELMHIITEN